MERQCDRCGQEVPSEQQMYSLRIEMFARVEPLVFTADDLAEDHQSKLEMLIEQMELMEPAEAEDQVHECYQFELCSRCREWMHRQLRLRQPKEN